MAPPALLWVLFALLAPGEGAPLHKRSTGEEDGGQGQSAMLPGEVKRYEGQDPPPEVMWYEGGPSVGPVMPPGDPAHTLNTRLKFLGLGSMAPSLRRRLFASWDEPPAHRTVRAGRASRCGSRLAGPARVPVVEKK